MNFIDAFQPCISYADATRPKKPKHMYQVYTAPSPYINVIQVHKPIESNSVVE